MISVQVPGALAGCTVRRRVSPRRPLVAPGSTRRPGLQPGQAPARKALPGPPGLHVLTVCAAGNVTHDGVTEHGRWDRWRVPYMTASAESMPSRQSLAPLKIARGRT